MKDTISLVINCDTRKGFLNKELHDKPATSGCLSADFLTEGIKNKVKFFEGYPLEVTIFIDIHEPVPDDILKSLTQYDNVILHKHSEFRDGRDQHFPKWLDLCIVQALLMAKGKWVVHTDCDMAMFKRAGTDPVGYHIRLLESGRYKYISYPCRYTPDPVIDPDFQDYNWVSTRFFFTRREQLEDYKEILKCLMNSEYLYTKYGEKKRQCPWFEHIIGMMVKKEEVLYPPHNRDYSIFSWASYKEGIFQMLNNLPFNLVMEFINKCGGIGHPCDVKVREELI